MAGGTFLPGVRTGDVRYERQQAKLAQSLSRLPRMALSGVTLEALRPWIARRLTELVGIDDEVLIDFFWNTLEAKQEVEAGETQLLLTQFMGKHNAVTFVSELWEWFGKAKTALDGVPEALRTEYDQFLAQTRKAEEATQKRTFKVSDVVVRRQVQQRRRSRSRSASPPHSRSSHTRRSGSQRGKSPSRSRSRRYRRDSRSSSRSRSPSREPHRHPSRSSRPLAESHGSHNQRPDRRTASPPRDTLRRRTDEARPQTPPRSPVSSSYSTGDEADASADEATLQLIERAKQLMNME